MILIALFLFIAVIVIALNMYNSSNLEEIENYIKNQKCENIIYSKGAYKSLCKDRLLEVSNSFNVDIKKNSKLYYYTDIKNLQLNTKKLELVINNEKIVSFKHEDELYEFYDKLEKRVKLGIK